MFVGRKDELNTLESLWAKDSFQMVVIYGRRRVGKTTLISQFVNNKRVLSFTALEQSDQNNLSDLSLKIQQFFSLPQTGSFASWQEAINYIGERAQTDPFVFVFDELPYAVQRNASIPSILQIAIDQVFKDSQAMIILCGSNQGAMESKVLGRKSPLYGRRTAKIELQPLGFRDAAKMLGNVTPQEAFEYYACFGGVPYYLDQVDRTLSFKENIAKLYFEPSGFLYEEPMGLLRQELSEPATYNSILRAIANGATKQSAIADKTGVQATTLTRYLKTLISLGIIERAVPYGENPDKSKRGTYRIKDACCDFWFRFVMLYTQEIESGLGSMVASAIKPDDYSNYLGRRFERLCAEWLSEQARKGALPFLALSVSSWWGTDSAKREETDIDALAANNKTKQLLLGECKYRNNFNETEAIEKLMDKKSLVKGYSAEWFYLFTKKAVSKKTAEKYGDAVQFVTVKDIYAK